MSAHLRATRSTTARRLTAARCAMAGTALAAAAALVGCGSSSTASTSTEPATSEASAVSPTSTSSSAATSSGAASTSASTGSSDGGGDAAGAIPLAELAPAEESAGAVQSEGEGGAFTFPDATTVATATAAFDATTAECGSGLATGHPVTCAITAAPGEEGGFDGEVFTAYAVRRGGNNGNGILFVQGKDPLAADLVELLGSPDTMVYGMQMGSMSTQRSRPPEELDHEVVDVTQNPDATLAWADGADGVQVDESSCSTGLTGGSFEPGSCHLVVGGGLEVDVTVLNAQWAGLGGEGGLIFVAHGTD